MSNIILEKTQNTDIITLNRPEKNNALNPALIQELTNAILSCLKTEARCIILKANGKHFCAGADLNWMQESKDFSVEKNKSDALALAKLLQLIANSTKPFISVIQGHAMGGACGIISASDFAIASQDVVFCFSEVKLGLVPATIAPYVLRRIGYQTAKRYFLTAESISTTQAQSSQLIDSVVGTHAEAIDSAFNLAEKLRKNGPKALKNCKELLNKLNPIDEKTIDDTSILLANIRVTDEAQEGINAFFDKRKPNWCKK